VLPSLRTLNWRSFLARPPLPSPSVKALDALHPKSMLVTGAGGSIGSALTLRLRTLAPRHLALLDASESRLYALQQACSESPAPGTMTASLGSVRDRTLLDEIFAAYAPRIVFHAAAFKHVPLMEEQPLAAIANNVFGSLTLASAAAAHGAKIVLLSTDKAVAPRSIMGATKRVAERIVLAAGGVVLRLGNVLATRDSVTEIFAHQIAAGGPLTVTDPAARRYFLTLDEAVDLLLIAAAESNPPVLLAPRIAAAHYITDLADFMTRALAPAQKIALAFTAPRPGDKETEHLWSPAETAQPAHHEGLLQIDSPALSDGELQSHLADLRIATDARDLAAALVHMQALVPDYSPSPALLAIAERHCPRVSR
jgi:FlaA1/EpsC-like NDP-sugar epimerase